MSRTTSKNLIERSPGAVGAFNVILLEHAEAYVAAAEKTNHGVVLQISENCVKYHGALAPIAKASIALAESSRVPISVHLDHAEDIELVSQALDLGFDSIMFDGSKLDYQANVESSRKIADKCRSFGATIEVELGEIGGKDGVHAPGVRTNPKEAKEFFEATGVDLMAVAVGSSHGQVTRDTKLDLELIKEIASILPIPLVLHGSSGVSDPEIQAAIRAGMQKINIATHLNHVFTDSVRETLSIDTKIVDPRKYFKSAREAVAKETERLIKVLALQ
jgi:fructose-bisphosphate aldolase class II